MENNTFLLVTCWLPVGYISDEELRQLGDFLLMQERIFHARIALIQIKCLFVPCARHKYPFTFLPRGQASIFACKFFVQTISWSICVKVELKR